MHDRFRAKWSILRHGQIAFASLLLLALLAGCSISYLDDCGRRHIVGLVEVILAPTPEPAKVAGDVVDLTSVGLSMGETAQGQYLAIGYFHEVSATLKDNVLVLGNPLDVTKPAQPSDKEAPE